AAIIAAQPAAMQLRSLQTLTEIAADQASTIVFPVPVNLLEALFGRAGSGAEK
ncbi:MAG: slipin family protein, partial [Desulfotomaculales bacterium]